MRIKSLNKKIWIELTIEELEDREEFAAVPLGCVTLICFDGLTCWTYRCDYPMHSCTFGCTSQCDFYL